MKKYLFLFFFILTFSFGAIDDFLPKLTSQVVDDAQILHVSTQEKLKNILTQEENNSSNQIVVATVPSLGGYEIEEFAIALARKWQIGQKDKDNGVLLLIAPNERKIRIEVGYGLEGALTDKTSHEIIEYTILPYFRQRDFDTGILKGVNNIISAVKGQYTTTKHIKENKIASKLPFFAAIFGFFLLSISKKFKSKTVRSLGISSFLSAFSLPITLSLFGLYSFAPFVIFIIIFIAIFLLTKNTNMVHHASNRDDFGHIGGFGGGSFGGGGFGGGGASGGW